MCNSRMRFSSLCRKSKSWVGTFDVCSGSCDLLLTRATHEFIKACFCLQVCAIGFGQSRLCPRIILAQQHCAGGNGIAFGKCDFDNWFCEFGGNLDSVRSQFANNSIGVVVGSAGRRRTREIVETISNVLWFIVLLRSRF